MWQLHCAMKAHGLSSVWIRQKLHREQLAHKFKKKINKKITQKFKHTLAIVHLESPTHPRVHSRFIHQVSNRCSFWMLDHAQNNYHSIAVCIRNDTMISLDISCVYGALFIDLAKVSDTVHCTFLLQQFKHDTDFTVAWFSHNIIGHCMLWGSWHCNNSAVSLLKKGHSMPPDC